jgi:hypothetical protein
LEVTQLCLVLMPMAPPLRAQSALGFSLTDASEKEILCKFVEQAMKADRAKEALLQ